MRMLIMLVSVAAINVCHAQQTQSLESTVKIPAKIDKPITPASKPESETAGNPLIGIWKSNSELTLTSLNTIEGISDDSREYLKQNVFGLLTREFTESRIRTYFGRIKEDEPSSAFQPYRIINSDASKITIEHTDPLTGKTINSTFYPENGCYYELVSKWQYKEYFCREQEGNKKKFIAIPKGNQEKLKNK